MGSIGEETMMGPEDVDYEDREMANLLGSSTSQQKPRRAGVRLISLVFSFCLLGIMATMVAGRLFSPYPGRKTHKSPLLETLTAAMHKDHLSQHERVLVLYSNNATATKTNQLANELATRAATYQADKVAFSALNCEGTIEDQDLCQTQLNLTSHDLPVMRWYYHNKHMGLLDYPLSDLATGESVPDALWDYIQRNLVTGELTPETKDSYIQGQERVFALSCVVACEPSLLTLWQAFAARVQATPSLESLKIVTYMEEEFMEGTSLIRWYHHGRFYRLEHRGKRTVQALYDFALHRVQVELITLNNETIAPFLQANDERALVYFFWHQQRGGVCDSEMISILDEDAEAIHDHRDDGYRDLPAPLPMALVNCDESADVCQQRGIPYGTCEVQWIRHNKALPAANTSSIQRAVIGYSGQIIEFARKQIELEQREQAKLPVAATLTAENWTAVLGQHSHLFVQVSWPGDDRTVLDCLASRVHPDLDLPVVVARVSHDVLPEEHEDLEESHVYRWYEQGVFVPPPRVFPKKETAESLLSHVRGRIEAKPLPLTPAIWNATMTGFVHVFCVFYWPWEPHFRKLEPTWDAFAELVGEHDSLRGLLRVAKMDCTEYDDFCLDRRIISSPDFRWYRTGKVVSPNYDGERTVEALMQYANKTISA